LEPGSYDPRQLGRAAPRTRHRKDLFVIKGKVALPLLFSLALLGCTREGEVTTAGVITTRSACPSVAIPAATGDVTLFNPANSRTADAIDVVAHITNLRGTCDETGQFIISNASFQVHGQRRNTSGAREVVLPYFATVVQGGTNVVSKRVGRVALRFAEGQARASTSATAQSQVLRAAATLPENIRRQITRVRKPGDADAALDPMSDPAVRTAVTRASFEFLVGFQLTQEQLAYNATR
jgi:hypothetical protein